MLGPFTGRGAGGGAGLASPRPLLLPPVFFLMSAMIVLPSNIRGAFPGEGARMRPADGAPLGVDCERRLAPPNCCRSLHDAQSSTSRHQSAAIASSISW